MVDKPQAFHFESSPGSFGKPKRERASHPFRLDAFTEKARRLGQNLIDGIAVGPGPGADRRRRSGAQQESESTRVGFLQSKLLKNMLVFPPVGFTGNLSLLDIFVQL